MTMKSSIALPETPAVGATWGGCRVGAVGAQRGDHLPEQRETCAHTVSVADARATLQLESIEMDHTRSRIMAMPWPTPRHRVQRAYRPPVRCNCRTAVATSRPP